MRWLLAVVFFLPATAGAGTYIFAGETNGLDLITHPPNYTGAGGEVSVLVCIDSSAADATAMEIPLRNVLMQLNLMRAENPNLYYGGSNNIPFNRTDFESVMAHEVGHCIGLAHPNIGSVPGVSGADTNFTRSGTGADGVYNLGAGSDGIPGSADDARGDDPNLHWFAIGVNDPFQELRMPNAGSYSRDTAYLPAGHTSVANASVQLGATLGYPNVEAVMQQGSRYDEDQRRWQADDITTLKMAMTGLDRLAGTADDYTIRMVYGGILADTSGCDITVVSDTNESFASCSVGGQYLSANHVRITQGTVSYNPNFADWFFNPDLLCSASEELLFANQTLNSNANHQACYSITYGGNFILGSSATLTATAPKVTLVPGTTIQGVFTVYPGFP